MAKRETELTLQGKEFKWMKELPLILNEYNNTIHSTIKMTPIQGSLKENEDKIKEIFNEKHENIPYKKPKFKVNDKVRLLKLKTTFEKGYTHRWTNEIFIITEICNTKPITYKVKDLKGKKLMGRYMNSNY